MWNNLTVNGFQFDNSTDYAEAKKEADAIDYLKSKMDIDNPEVAIKVYYKLLDRQNLHTIIGYTFLKQLRDFCIDSGIVNDNQIKSIIFPSVTETKGKIDAYGDEVSLEIDSSIDNTQEQVDEGFKEFDKGPAQVFAEQEKKLKRDIQNLISKQNKLNTVAEHYRHKSNKCICVIAALVIIIIALFGISIYNGTFPYNDVEKEIQNKYAAWAEELSERESKIKTAEAILDKEK